MSTYALIRLTGQQAETIGSWGALYGSVQIERTERPSQVFLYFGRGKRRCVQITRDGRAIPREP